MTADASERERAARLADDSLTAFVARMSAAGNPGSGRHELGMRRVRGWVLDYDPAVGGASVQAVIGLDGTVHAVRRPRALRTVRYTGSEWVLRDAADPDPVAAATRFADRLAHILEFDRVGGDDEPPTWES